MRRLGCYLLLAAFNAGLHSSQAQEKPRLRSMHLAGQTDSVIEEAFQLYGVSVTFVKPIRGLEQPLQLDLKDADLATTSAVLDLLTRCFFVPVNPHAVLAVQDDREHRADYERLFTEAIEIPNLQPGDAEQRSEVEGLLSSLFDIKRSTLRGNTLTVRASKRDLVQIEDTLSHLFQPAPQVLLEVKAYVVSRNRNRNLGVEPPQQVKIFNLDTEAETLITSNSSVVAALIAAGTVVAGDTIGIAEALIAEGYGSSSVLSSSFVTLGGGLTETGIQFGSLPANASLTASSSQQLQSVMLRLSNNETGKLRIGQRYPIETASTTALGTTSSATTTPSIEYEDLGLTIEAKAQVRFEGEVLLQIHGIMRALDGTSLNSIPIIDNQEFVSSLSVAAGATTVVVSNLSKTEARTVEGFAGLMPTDSGLDQQTSELVVTLTPHLIAGGLQQLSQ
jgi:general secretion pathway protein D